MQGIFFIVFSRSSGSSGLNRLYVPDPHPEADEGEDDLEVELGYEVGEARADVAADGGTEGKSEGDMLRDVAEPVVCEGSNCASRYHREERRALGEVLGHADEDDEKGHHDAASSDAHHPREEPGEGTGSDQGGIVQKGTESIGRPEDDSFEDEKKGHDDKEPAEGALELLLREGVGIEGTEAGGDHCADGKDERRPPIGESVQAVRDGADECGEDDREEARAMGLVLGEPGEYRHERDHDDAAAKPDKPAEGSPRQPDQKTLSLTFVERFRSHKKPIYHERAGLSMGRRRFKGSRGFKGKTAKEDRLPTQFVHRSKVFVACLSCFFYP